MTKNKLSQRLENFEEAFNIIWDYQTNVVRDICGIDEDRAAYNCLNRRFALMRSSLISELYKAMFQRNYSAPHKGDMPFLTNVNGG